VQKDSYLLELTRYVVLNPVRTGIVDEVQAWSWSSYAATINQSPCPEWLQTKWLLKQFGAPKEQAIKNYIDFVHAGVGLPTIWKALKHQIYLGDESFIPKIQDQIDLNRLSQIEEIPRTQHQLPANPLIHFVETFVNTKQGMYEAYKTGDYTMQQIAIAFKVHYSTVSRAIKQGENT